MRIKLKKGSKDENGSLVPILVMLALVLSVVASLATYVTQTVNVANRRNSMVAALQYAQGAAVVAAANLNSAVTNRTNTLFYNLTTLPGATYTLNAGLGGPSQKVYTRTISSPFSNQTVSAEIWLTNTPNPTTAKIVARAKVNKTTQMATVNVKMTWAYPGAIISTSPGTADTGTDAATAKKGNVAVDGDKNGPLIIDGGPAMAILANGRANIDTNYATIPKASISMTNYNTANQIPDYTAQGTANTLFDFNRFIAVADSTVNPLNTAKLNNHFTNLLSFLVANKAALATPAKALEGVIVVDITATDKTKDLGIDVLADPASYPAYITTNGISIKGTLFFNFGPAWGPLDKLFNRAPMNVNPANLSGLVANNPATYPSGYPPVYFDVTKNPSNINITSKGFANFTPEEDLPAVMYSIGTVDMHGPVNISGVVYTPSYIEIENKPNEGFKIANQTQYFKGTLIMGLGVYYQNTQAATSIISFDAKTLDSLATLSNAGKQVTVAYWQ